MGSFPAECKISGDLTGNFTDLYQRIGQVLINEEKPMKDRFRALFTLRNLGGEEGIRWISAGFKDSSALLKHECAYCLGQMTDPRAVTILIAVLSDQTEDPMVRHEAGEALGAIADERGIPVLERFKDDPRSEVAETCQLALDRIKWMKSNPDKLDMLTSRYLSVDPTPCSNETSVAALEAQLLDEDLNLFDRYCAMFTLRNIGTDDAVKAIAKGLRAGGPLFRHEIAYVLGQIQSSICVKELAEGLSDEAENPMVRHECADALGSLANEYGTSVLRKYLQDPERVVRESCEIGLDISDYEQSGDFQYANVLEECIRERTVQGCDGTLL